MLVKSQYLQSAQSEVWEDGGADAHGVLGAALHMGPATERGGHRPRERFPSPQGVYIIVSSNPPGPARYH